MHNPLIADNHCKTEPGTLMPNPRHPQALRRNDNAIFHGLAALLLTAGAVFASATAEASPILDPYAFRNTSTGDGLNSRWVQTADDWRFSDYVYNGERIGDTSWGSGFWAVSDIATAMALNAGDPNLVAGAQGITRDLSFANNLYNDGWGQGTGWDKDHVRPLAPVVADSGQETNYAATFTGYIYIPQAGVYDFGIFVDDAFTLSLVGGNGSLVVGRETFIGSSGRDFYTLSGSVGGSIELAAGFYGIELDYFNRLEAGVLELGWWQPGQTEWTPISGDLLYSALPVPEPSSALLLLIAGGALVVNRRRRHH